MGNMSAADMFALMKRGHESFSSENKSTNNKNVISKMLGKAAIATSVMLATQLDSKADEEDQQPIDNINTGSLATNISSIEATPAGNVEAISQTVPTQTASLATQSITTSSIPASNLAGTQNLITETGLPRNFVTESVGVSDPSQQTSEAPLEISSFERGISNIPNGSSSSGTTQGLNGIDGADGRDGVDGINGTDGRDGADGINGTDGRDGTDGINGADGRDGADGINGTDGRDGVDGINGTDGRDGVDGINGIDGRDGADGINGTDGRDGADGQTVLFLDSELLQEYDIIDALIAQGVSVSEGPLGTVAISINSSQLEEITNFINSVIPEQPDEDNFVHGASPVSGTDQEDLLVGTSDDDILSSLGANDILIGGEGSDTLLGGDGNDTASYFSSNEGVNIDLATNVNTGGDALGDMLSSIENLIGSAFVDNLSGDNANNEITGDLGADLLFGGGGTDLLHGGADGDLLDGGTSNDDVATYFDSDDAISISLANDTASGGHAEGDELDNIEFVDGSLFDDFIQGDNQGNRLGGLFGEDILLGEGGNDVLLGGNSADIINGGSGIDTSDYTASLEGVQVNLETGLSRFGEAEGDTIISIENLAGSAFDDVLTGDEGVNRLTGRDGDDMLFGGAGNDRLVGGLGADHFDGGEGTRDAADYSAATQAVGVDLIAGGFAGEATGDTFTGIEFIVGSDDHDTLLADDGINRINGGDGCDVIFGRGGNDILLGEAGDDILNGGEGNDVFIFGADDGNDIIEDFEAGFGRTDRIQLQDGFFDSFEDVQSAITDTDNGALLTLESGSILFQNLNSAEFTADDFILG